MPNLAYQDLKASISFSGKVHIQLRRLDVTLTEQELLAKLYPVFDAEEKALVPQDTTDGPSHNPAD